MTDDPKRYLIRTVSDFLAVPSDRREVCIREFVSWCECIDALAVLTEVVGQVGSPPDCYEWIDDDKHTMTAMVECGEERIVVAHGVIREFAEGTP